MIELGLIAITLLVAVLLVVGLRQQRQLQTMQDTVIQLQQKLAAEGCASRGMGEVITRLQQEFAENDNKHLQAPRFSPSVVTAQHRSGIGSRQERDLLVRLARA